jgi:aspartyl-tRNA synthetase
VKSGGQVKGVRYPGGASLTRREIDALPAIVKPYGAKGVAWIGVTGPAGEDGTFPADSLRSQITKFLSDAEIAGILQAADAQEGDMVLLVADKASVVAASLSALRLEIGKRTGLIDPDELAFCWVIDFPLVEHDEEEDRWAAVHHPFTSARDEDWATLESDPGAVRAKAYDVVLNGWEIGGGSIRIHRSDLQHRLFSLLKLSEEEIQEQFGHMIDAFQYGAPPHGGIALGIERIVALYSDSASIRDVMAFPKTATGTDLMVGSPSPVSDAQLTELGIAVVAEE